jgi:hypothetical protein
MLPPVHERFVLHLLQAAAATDSDEPGVVHEAWHAVSDVLQKTHALTDARALGGSLRVANEGLARLRKSRALDEHACLSPQDCSLVRRVAHAQDEDGEVARLVQQYHELLQGLALDLTAQCPRVCADVQCMINTHELSGERHVHRDARARDEQAIFALFSCTTGTLVVVLSYLVFVA